MTMNLKMANGSYPVWTGFKPGDYANGGLKRCIKAPNYSDEWDYVDCTNGEVLEVKCIGDIGMQYSTSYVGLQFR